MNRFTDIVRSGIILLSIFSHRNIYTIMCSSKNTNRSKKEPLLKISNHDHSHSQLWHLFCRVFGIYVACLHLYCYSRANSAREDWNKTDEICVNLWMSGCPLRSFKHHLQFGCIRHCIIHKPPLALTQVILNWLFFRMLFGSKEGWPLLLVR